MGAEIMKGVVGGSERGGARWGGERWEVRGVRGREVWLGIFECMWGNDMCGGWWGDRVRAWE